MNDVNTVVLFWLIVTGVCVVACLVGFFLNVDYWSTKRNTYESRRDAARSAFKCLWCIPLTPLWPLAFAFLVGLFLRGISSEARQLWKDAYGKG